MTADGEAAGQSANKSFAIISQHATIRPRRTGRLVRRPLPDHDLSDQRGGGSPHGIRNSAEHEVDGGSRRVIRVGPQVAVGVERVGALM